MLNTAKMVWLKDTFINCLDTELDRLILANKDKTVLEYIVEFYIKERLHRILLPYDIVKITNELFSHIEARDFILELTDRLSINLSLEDINIKELIDTICIGLKNTHKDNAMLNMMPVQISQSLSIKPDLDIEGILYDNFWIVTLILLLMWFNFSKHFDMLLQNA